MTGALLALLTAGWLPGAPAHGRDASAPSARYSGPVTYYDAPAAEGTIVSAHLGHRLLATTTVVVDEGQMSYTLVVPGDDPETPAKEGPAEGQPFTFRVNGVTANEVERFNAGEDRRQPLTVSRIEVCLGAFDDLDRDGAHDPGEPWLSGVTIKVLQFIVERSYTTTGADEPSCALHAPQETIVRAVDWPLDYDPLVGQGQPSAVIEQARGVFYVSFPFVWMGSDIPTRAPTTTPATPTATPEQFPGPTSDVTATPSATGVPGTPSPSPTASPVPPTRTPTPAVTAVPSETPTATPERQAVLTVNSAVDPGTVGDAALTLREAMRLATGRLSLTALSSAELMQLDGQPGPESSDRITFDASIFPTDLPRTIVVRPPSGSPDPTPTPGIGGAVLSREPFPGLPVLDTGGDIVDAVGAGVVLSAGIGGTLFDGVVMAADGNVLRGLTLRGFNAAVMVVDGRGNTIGGTAAGEGVTAVGNISGVVIESGAVEGGVAVDTAVYGSRIGVEADGVTANGNATHGVLVGNGARGTRIGRPGAGNVISGNFQDGLAVLGADTRDTRIEGNRIGVDAGGTQAIGNGIGVVVGSGAADTQLGSAAPGGGNLIGGNVAQGVWIVSPATQRTTLEGNAIGVAPTDDRALPNRGAGVLIDDGAHDNRIGGQGPGAGNRIAYNGGAGVLVRGRRTSRNTISRNSITANAGPGIALQDGANDDIAAPVLTRVEPSVVEGIAVAGSRVELFSDPADEGATFEGSATADADGRFRIAAPAPFAGPSYSATNTDAAGNTSAFGRRAQPTPTATGVGSPTAGPEVTPSATTTPRPPGPIHLPVLLRSHVYFARLTLDPARATVPMGGLHDLDLVVHDVERLFGMQLMLRFDPNRLEVIDADPEAVGVQIGLGPFPGAEGLFVAENSVDNSTGQIRFAFTMVEDTPISGSGVAARIRLRGRAPGRAQVDFEEAMLSDNVASRIRFTRRGATIDVLPPPTATPPPSATPLPTATALPSATVPPTEPPTAVPTASAVPTETAAPSQTPVSSATVAPTEPPTSTATPAPSETVVPSATPVPSGTAPPSATPTVRPAPSETVVPSATPIPTETPVPSATVVPSATPLPSETPVRSPTPLPSFTPTGTATAVPSATALPSVTPRVSATPTLIASRTPTASATPDGGCARPLVDGGFETDGAWTLAGGRPPRYVDHMAFAGRRSLLLGVVPGEANTFSYSTTWQPVAVPADATTLTLAARTYQAAQPGGGPDRQLMLVYDVDPAENVGGQHSPVAYVFGERVNAGVWQRRTITLDVTAYRGQMLWVYATVANDGFGGRAWMYLDEVEAVFCP